MKFYMLALPDFYSLLLVYLSSGPSMPFLHILPEIIGIVPGAYLFKIYIFTYFLLLWCTLITRAQWLQWVGLVPPRHVGLWFPVSWPGIEPASPALESELSTTGPQGKSPWCVSYSHTRALSALGWERNWFYLSCFPLSQAHRASSVLVVRYLMREWNDSQLQVVLGKNGGRLSLIWPLQTGVNEICNHAGGLTWDGLVGTAAMGNSLWCFPYRAIFQYSSTISHAMGLKKPRMNNQGMEMRRIK